ncbi:kinase [Cordyceps javanica]|uniref:Isopentenyl phosphate kinase n=1 Tax=Cordyceps javanica TaxID=43265 RepID=A0A545W2R2_9HYPO|nr:kinase [Cordyceps javanica]TQW08281.1 kinase [Cordyceps javanica]
MSIVVVKLGGAAITDKSVPDTLSHNIDALIDSVAHAYHRILRPSGRRLILIHGAGSFGHPPAKKYQVKAGWTTALDEAGGDDAEQARDNVKFGMALTRQRVLQLHTHVIQRLHERECMPVLSVSTYDTVETDNGAVIEGSSVRLMTRVQQVLEAGFVPLLFGDAVFDRALGSTILSGDALMYHLAERLPAVQRCVFVTDVAGIFTQDPKRFPDATLIKMIHCSEVGDSSAIDKDDSAASVDDVTGAMRSKWQWAKRIVTDAEQVRAVAICQVSDSSKAIGYEFSDASTTSHESGNWTAIVR